jgi:CheY-like chemotaxis protein
MAASLKTLGLRALVVDDSDMNRLMLTRLLRGLGIVCDAAEHGAVAVAKMEEATSAGAPPDLITMDRSMPVMDGMDATRRIRGDPIGFAGLVVGITGDANRGDQDDFLRSGVDVVLPKPLIKADLVRLLHGRFAPPPQSTPLAAAAPAT